MEIHAPAALTPGCKPSLPCPVHAGSAGPSQRHKGGERVLEPRKAETIPAKHHQGSARWWEAGSGGSPPGSSAWLKRAAAQQEEGRAHPTGSAAKLGHPRHCPCPFPTPGACRGRKERSASSLRPRERGEVEIWHLFCCPCSPTPRPLRSACCLCLPVRQGRPRGAKGHIWSRREICLHLQALGRKAGGSPAAGAEPLTLPTPSRLGRAGAGFISLALAAGLS